MKQILLVLLVVAISLSCLLIAVEINAFNLELYNRNFEKHRINMITGKSFDELEDIANDLILYLDGKETEKKLEMNFNEREVLHMKDVKVLFQSGKLLRTISVILAINLSFYFYIKKEKSWIKSVFLGLFSNWIILIVLGAMIYFDFSKYFTIFHHIFFTNDLWLLNPKTDLLIQMLPEDFFMIIASRIVVFFIVFLSIIQGVLYIIMRRDKDGDEGKRKKKSFR